MSFFEYVLTPILFFLHIAVAYAVPLVATLRSRNNGQRWIIHWILFFVFRLTIFSLFDLLFDGCIYWLLIVGTEVGLLFALAQHTDAVKYKLLQLVDQGTAIAGRYIEIVKKQIQKTESQAQKVVAN